jgi:hypothetical protein
MMFVDEGRSYIGWKRGMWYHLASDANPEELQTFARRLRLNKNWFQDHQVPHYDISENRALLAIQLGAVRLSNREFSRRMYNRYGVAPAAEPVESKPPAEGEKEGHATRKHQEG